MGSLEVLPMAVKAELVSIQSTYQLRNQGVKKQELTETWIEWSPGQATISNDLLSKHTTNKKGNNILIHGSFKHASFRGERELISNSVRERRRSYSTENDIWIS